MRRPTHQERFRLRRAWSDRMRAIQAYYDAVRPFYAAVRQGDLTQQLDVSELAARCRETDIELTEAMQPFMAEAGA